eukprot:CAMPEP_0185569720 /NCGR_PEP_ID=MMETSP0434-20130131/2256_1 /TAXON_ID=626734 ORGANISM="Favella taraikaensis, Strain Fe Narragansett Bay" /NCGR_SAMPLE_ID=MMETSP0434 /ASSEMBLY_ACC=CAM_ASM_000379 /LENGTH=57 /DNA_ID=CAMNT_0028184593 /DNA_START=721 /DNA_END=890 /DNA_ORIENTATION=-
MVDHEVFEGEVLGGVAFVYLDVELIEVGLAALGVLPVAASLVQEPGTTPRKHHLREL